MDKITKRCIECLEFFECPRDYEDSVCPDCLEDMEIIEEISRGMNGVPDLSSDEY